MGDPKHLGGTSHIVSHLLREVESAVRAVLGLRDAESGQHSSSGQGHRQSIASVLRALQVDESDPIGRLWLTLPGDEGLDKKAHRNALFQPRPVDADFLNYWDQIQVILDLVLSRFEERYLDYHQVLDELAALDSPTEGDVQRLKQRAPNNLVAYNYFFEKLSSPKWLELLSNEGFFGYPPAHETDGERVSFPAWPQSKYLLRMTGQEPKAVVDIILSVPATENPIVLTDFAEAACQVAPDEAVRLIASAKSWIGNRHLAFLLLPEALGKLIAHLAEGNYIHESLDLAGNILAIRPAFGGDGEPSPDLSRYRRTRAEGYCGDWKYGEILRLRLPTLIRSGGIDALRLLCNLLDEAVTIYRGDSEENVEQQIFREDYSVIW